MKNKMDKLKQIYLEQGYSRQWINIRIKGIPIRNELTSEWKKRGVNLRCFSILTNEISVGTFGITTKEHRKIKKLTHNENLRDNMSLLELTLTSLAEVTTTYLHRTNDSKGMNELLIDAKSGGEIASITRKNIEDKTKEKIITSLNAKDFKKNYNINFF